MENIPILEFEVRHPETGMPIRIYDTRSFNRLEQTQLSKIEIVELDFQEEIVKTHPSQTTIRWIYKYEMELLLRLAGFKNWEIFGNFNYRPLISETDAMIVRSIK